MLCSLFSDIIVAVGACVGAVSFCVCNSLNINILPPPPIRDFLHLGNILSFYGRIFIRPELVCIPFFEEKWNAFVCAKTLQLTFL